jgi:hypothetical protein
MLGLSAQTKPVNEPGKPFVVDRVRRRHQQDRDGATVIESGCAA